MIENIKKVFHFVTYPIVFIQNHFKAVLLVVVLVFISSKSDVKIQKENLYKISIDGAILNSDKFLEELQKAKKENIKGLLVLINSPGGLVAPSVEMMMAIREYQKTRPVVVYAKGLLASGSYYASIYANTIIANPGSVVGSIGVIFQSVNIKELLDKIGIKPMVIKSGKYKEAGAIYRDLKEYEKKELQTLNKDIYNMFVQDVIKARGLNKNNIDKFANGRVFVASKAKKIGLIDKVGSIEDAKNELIKLSKVNTPIWNKKSKIDTFLEDIESKTVSSVYSLISQKILTKF